MHEISAAQAAAGLDPALFEAMARVYAEIAATAARPRRRPKRPAPSCAEALRASGSLI